MELSAIGREHCGDCARRLVRSARHKVIRGTEGAVHERAGMGSPARDSLFCSAASSDRPRRGVVMCTGKNPEVTGDKP